MLGLFRPGLNDWYFSAWLRMAESQGRQHEVLL